MHFLITFEIEKQIYNNEKYSIKKINIFNSLSTYYLVLASKESDNNKREEYFNTIKLYLNKSDRIFVGESVSLAFRGNFNFIQKNN